MRRLLIRFLIWLRSSSSLARWSLLALLVGIIAGFGAILFYWLLEQGTHWLLAGIGGYEPPAPSAEGNRPPSELPPSWIVPLVVAAGGLVSGILVQRFAPEAAGHGTDAAIEAFHHREGRVRLRVIPVKVIASAITIGSGGSGGREGPTAQIAAGLGSYLAELLRLRPTDRRILLAVGMGAGIGAIFRAPLGGAVLAAEILYLHDFEAAVLFPAFLASIVAFAIFGSWAGWEPIFGSRPDLRFASVSELPAYAGLGILCGLVGIVYAKTFYGVEHGFRRLPLPAWLRPALGGLLTGLLGLAFPQALGTGYGWVQWLMDPAHAAALSLGVLLLLPFVKILATACSIGSGGSGGIFGPGVVIGAFLGVAWWRILTDLGVPGTPGVAPLVIIGMMALFGSIAHASLATMLMVAEMTGNLSLLAPAMLAVGIASIVVGNRTIYRNQVPRRADSPAFRLQYSFPLLRGLQVRDAKETPPLVLRLGMPAAEALRQLESAGLSAAPVVDAHDRFVGIVFREQLSDGARLDERSVVRGPTAQETERLDEVFQRVIEQPSQWLPVVDENDQFQGIVTPRGILAAYRRASRDAVRHLEWVTTEHVLLDVSVPSSSPSVGRALKDLRLPSDALVIAIRRGGTTLLPRGDTRIEAGDRLTVLVKVASAGRVRDFFERHQVVDTRS